MHEQENRNARIRHIAAGALAALAAVAAIAAVGAIAGTGASVSKPPVRVTGPAQSAPRPLRNAVQQLVNNATITAAQGQTLDSDIKAGTVHPDQLASQGFTQTQIEAVQRALRSAKVQLARGAHGSSAPRLRR